ncbi:MAG: peptide chain release factor N(5)-glutamine methyltransferase [Marinicella pacifica]
MNTIAQWLASEHQGIPLAVRRQLLTHVLEQSTAWLYAHDDLFLTTQQTQQLNQYLKHYSAGKPLAYITGEQAFWDVQLKVNEHTLIPRPDTELIIETVLELPIKPKQILDLGTGSGALAIVLARLFPDSAVTATDISPEALKVARKNAQIYRLNHIQFIQSHWFSKMTVHDFDLIVSNPPYIEPGDLHLEDLNHEPISALVAEQRGLADLKIIIEQAADYLQANGLLVVEHGYNQQQAVFELFTENKYRQVQSLFDIEQRPRATLGYKNRFC